VGNLYDYFAADDDETAAAALELALDPGRSDVLDVKGLDPVLPLATLESLLRGVEYEQVWADPRRCKLLTDPGHESCWVVTITDTLRDALASAGSDELGRAAVPWSETDDFRGKGVAEMLGDFLLRFAGLARTAHERDQRLYCRISL
jgi:hypothetical protein